MVIGSRGNEKLVRLRALPLFEECPDKALRRVAGLVDEILVPAEAVLTREGSPGRECFIIVEGTASVRLRDRRLGRLGPGDFFGEMALLDNPLRAATVTAETPMRLFLMEPRAFVSIISEAPTVTAKVLRELSRRLREVEEAPTTRGTPGRV